MKIIYYGHSYFSFETLVKTLFFDPFISPNKLASSIDPETIKPDYILLSSGHRDHVTDVEKIHQYSTPKFIGMHFNTFAYIEIDHNQAIEPSKITDRN